MVEIFIKIDSAFKKLDIKEGVQFPITYSITDIAQPEKRKQSFSKTIQLPSTKVNDEIFSHAFNVNRAGGYEANKKAEVIVFEDNIEVFTGNLKLTNVKTKAHKDGLRLYYYDVNLFGELTDIFFDIGKDRLSDLDFSEFDHTYDRFRQSNSWASSIVFNGSSVPFSLGFGYVYPLIDYGTSTDQINYEVKDLRPAIYVKTIWDKILSTYGYTNVFPFYNQSLFRSLIIPMTRNRLELTQAEIESFLFSAFSSSDTLLSTTKSNGQLIVPNFVDDLQTLQLDSENFDNGNNYNNTLFEYTTPERAFYSFSLSGDIDLNISSLSPNPWKAAVNYKLILEIVRDNGAVLAANAVNFNLTNQPLSGPGSTLSLSTSSQPDPNGVFTNNGQDPDSASKFNVLFSDVEIPANVQVFARAKLVPIFAGLGLTIDGSNNYYGGTLNVNVKANTTLINKIKNNTLLEGGTVSMSNVLPKDVLIKDFISSIIKMFNLYIQTDKENSKELNILPYVDFYDSSGVLDWSEKLDYDNDQEIKPLGALTGGRYLYKYKDDNDEFNKRYKDTYGETYGQYKEDVNNDFLKNEIKTELIFSPTPVADTGFSDLIMPRIFQTETSGAIKPYAANIRILTYGGLRSVTGQFFNHLDQFGNSTSYTEYPYSGMWDDPFNPTFCLEFGLPREVYYNDLLNTMNVSNNTLYNVYYKSMIDEISSPYSVLFTGLFKLDPKDLLSLNFRTQYYFSNEYWRLNKIMDYQSGLKLLTKCEFIKVIDVNPFVGEIEENNGAIDGLPNLNTFTPINANSTGGRTPGEQVDIQGFNNIVSPFSKSVSINGDSNFVAGGTERISIVGDNNNIAPNVKNVTLINTSGVDVLESDVIYMNGKKTPKDSVITINEDTTLYDYYDLIEVDLSTTSVVLNIPRAAGNGGQIQRIIIGQISGVNTLTIRAQGDTIDSLPEKVLIKLYNSVTLQSNDKEYFTIE